MRCWALAIALLLLAVASAAANEEWTHQQCLDYGFNKEQLVCSICKTVQNIVADQSDMYERCLKCCTTMDSASNAAVKNDDVFERAVLLVDKNALPFLPDVDHIVKNKRKLKVEVKYRYGPPQLQMYKSKANTDPDEIVSVHNWDKSIIVEYLSTHLSTKKTTKAATMQN